MAHYSTSLRERSLDLAVAVLRLAPRLAQAHSYSQNAVGQVVRSSGAIGAALEEAAVALSRRDMAHKQAIALREARETHHWLTFLKKADILPEEIAPLLREANEIVAMLTVSVRKLRNQV